MPDSKDQRSKKAEDPSLRARAEEILNEGKQPLKGMSTTELSTLVHELQVHQIELELQNTALFQAQVETQHVYQRYRDLWELSPTAYLTIDSYWRVSRINEAGRFLFGRTQEVLRGKRFVSLLQPNDRVPAHLMMEHATAGGAPERREVGVERPDNDVRQCLLVCYAPKGNPEDEYVLVTLTDITERKRAEEVLAKREEQLRLALEAGRIGLWDRNMETGEIEWGLELYELLGRDPAGPPIQGDTFFDYIHPDDRPRVSAHADEWIKKGGLFHDEFRVIRDDGQECWLASQGQARRNESGDVVRLLGINYDTTAQKKHEEQLRRAKAEAEDANQVKDRFLANVSHELRTPLSGIMGLADVLATRLRKPENQYYIRLIKESAQSLNELLNEVLDSAQIKSGEVRISARRFNVRRRINRSVGLFQDRAKKGGNRIRSRVDPAMPVFLSGDADRLDQILRNLISNAVKFTQNGTITVDADCQLESPEHATVTFKVRDTGPGIPEENHAQLFEEFFQVENPLTKKYPGTGLGLAIARKLVQAMRGLIWVESREGEGATFFVEVGFGVPADQTDAEVEISEGLELSLSQPLQVLVAEDNRINQLYIRRMLENMGHHPIMVEDGQAAVDALQKNHFDVVLMDIQMPIMDGYTAIRHIRESDLFNRNLPIFALTAYASENDVEKALEAGADGHIVKPVDFEELQWILQQTARKSKAKESPGKKRWFPTNDEIMARFGKNPALYLELCEKIRSDLPERIAKIKDHLACGDVSGAARECHSLADIGATIGDENLWRVSLDSETTLLESSEAGDYRGLEQMETATAGTLKYLDDLTEQLSEMRTGLHD